MAVLLRPKENLKTTGFKPFGGSGAIWSLSAQAVTQPAIPAAQGGEWVEGESTDSSLVTKYTAAPEGTAVAGSKVWIYVQMHGTSGANWQYGHGSFGENGQGFVALANGWNSLTIASPTLAIINAIWVELQPVHVQTPYGLQEWCSYIQVGEETTKPTFTSTVAFGGVGSGSGVGAVRKRKSPTELSTASPRLVVALIAAAVALYGLMMLAAGAIMEHGAKQLWNLHRS